MTTATSLAVKTTYTVANHGTFAFPLWQVWAEPEDKDGYTIETECVFIKSFDTMKEALAFAQAQK